MKSKLIAAVGGILVITTAIVVPASRMQADDNHTPDLFSLNILGFQANSSSPFLLKEDKLIGEGAVWQRLVGPILSNTFATIPSGPGSPATFGGATCQAEYSQAQILTEDGSTIIFNVYGVRCEPNDAPGAHSTSGSYDIVSGTGRFQNIRGAGSVTIVGHADGSAFIHIDGVQNIHPAPRPHP